MERDILKRVIETNEGEGTLGEALKKAAKTPDKVPLQKNPDDEWMLDALFWINNKCKADVKLVNIEYSNWYHTINTFHKQVAKRFPLETKILGGYIWVEMDLFDKWLIDIKEVGKYVSVTKVTKGTTDDYFPDLIFRYTLLCSDNLG